MLYHRRPSAFGANQIHRPRLHALMRCGKLAHSDRGGVNTYPFAVETGEHHGSDWLASGCRRAAGLGHDGLRHARRALMETARAFFTMYPGALLALTLTILAVFLLLSRPWAKRGHPYDKLTMPAALNESALDMRGQLFETWHLRPTFLSNYQPVIIAEDKHSGEVVTTWRWEHGEGTDHVRDFRRRHQLEMG